MLVYQLSRSRSGYRPRAYAPSPRPARGAHGVRERLEAALQELVEGPTRAEHRAGLTSAFGPDTGDILLSADVRRSRAIVDFRDFRRSSPQWGTSYGGSVFLMQLNLTVFQFERVATAQYRIEGSCRRFWEFLQVVVCDPVRAGPYRRSGSRPG